MAEGLDEASILEDLEHVKYQDPNVDNETEGVPCCQS